MHGIWIIGPTPEAPSLSPSVCLQFEEEEEDKEDEAPWGAQECGKVLRSIESYDPVVLRAYLNQQQTQFSWLIIVLDSLVVVNLFWLLLEEEEEYGEILFFYKS